MDGSGPRGTAVIPSRAAPSPSRSRLRQRPGQANGGPTLLGWNPRTVSYAAAARLARSTPITFSRRLSAVNANVLVSSIV